MPRSGMAHRAAGCTPLRAVSSSRSSKGTGPRGCALRLPSSRTASMCPCRGRPSPPRARKCASSSDRVGAAVFWRRRPSRAARQRAPRSAKAAFEQRTFASRLTPATDAREKLVRRSVMRQRSSWDEYFMDIARQVASRATCDRKHVGALLVRDRTILSTGYNGSIRGLPHCDEAGHMMENGHCVATVHAEANAVIQAAKNGVRIDAATMYTSASPCWSCFKLIANAGCTRIVYGEFYRDHRIFEFAAQLGIELVGPGPQVSGEGSPQKDASDRPEVILETLRGP